MCRHTLQLTSAIAVSCQAWTSVSNANCKQDRSYTISDTCAMLDHLIDSTQVCISRQYCLQGSGGLTAQRAINANSQAKQDPGLRRTTGSLGLVCCPIMSDVIYLISENGQLLEARHLLYFGDGHLVWRETEPGGSQLLHSK